jgi:DNA-binding HxlR family transcriptional regulator
MIHDAAGCASFAAAMDVLAKPWTGLILTALERGPVRFGVLRDSVGDIGDRMLSVRLRELELRGLVTRRVIEGPPVRVEYELTAAGRGFRDVSNAIRKWGATILRASGEGGAEDEETTGVVAAGQGRGR